MPKIRSRSTRRAPPLKDSDYDHEISLVDNADADGDAPGASDEGNHLAPPTATTLRPGGDAANDDNERERRLSGQSGRSAAADTVLSPATTSASTAPLLPSFASAAAAAPTARAGAGTAAAAGMGDSASPARPPSRGRGLQRRESTGDAASKKLTSGPTVNVNGLAADDGVIPGDRVSADGQAQPELRLHRPDRTSADAVRMEPEAAIDILYENERGGFLCGIPLFSARALGNLDPSPWTNYLNKTSPTDIHTAQVPDPTWEWVWPDWRINHDDGTDKDGWEYSFMFARCFSWHGPSWYNSFVRRRAWTRKRAKKGIPVGVLGAAVPSAAELGDFDSEDNPLFLGPQYFNVVSAASMRRSSSRASSRLGSRASLGGASTSRAPSRAGADRNGTADGDDDDDDDDDDENDDPYAMPAEIGNTDVLMRFLRCGRIDREKIEAVTNFLEYGGEDLVRLQDLMPEIMALFVFQASRRTLLTVLTKAFDDAVDARAKAVDEAERGGNANADADADAASAPVPQTDAGDGKDKQKADQAVSPSDEPAAPQDEPDTDTTPSNETTHKLQALGRRVGYLRAAVQHADEEVRRLEYWSDIKAMAQSGATKGAVDSRQGWEAPQWQGVDQSGPAPPRPSSPTKAPSEQT
ncbi:peroxin 23-like protein [Niveomyces insectorum RCEF 264]|uniref:Peroxin 23-like protein n=1 Tax=Niveomyces insectorum RCEF 264 TaxID=1081102 RepID=A0A167ZZ67_9HYPO|nr:peroxin 23-like protein [Niveomyces insectorum RCEF 264]